ncbi:uncharacterized protein (TIGR02302 family) [Tepidamorphus gemmatus]|uniref:Uncharacterized protein (TIGR02302 family) n=2 Tax=Tepidamorphus gemmatus TaxID=747076 RepID=A0A4R3MDI8_9HYPH|nr:uncharacterized protein (TIGR02302 family) [Tepidamorphus gemmatus]
MARPGMTRPRGRPTDATEPAGRFARSVQAATRRAAAALAVESIWPALIPALIVVAVYCIVSWFGLWLSVGPALRIAGLALFAATFLAALWPLTRARLPQRDAARHRVESRSGLAHRPLTALEDRMSGQASDPATDALWAAHRARAAASIGRLSAGAPQPRVAARDPYALRAIVLLVFVIALTWAGPDWYGRLVSATGRGEVREAVAARIDAWVSPPRYTGRPPMLLSGPSARPVAESRIEVPQGSRLVIRAPRDADVEVSAVFGSADPVTILPTAPAGDAVRTATGPAEYEIELETAGSVAIGVGGRKMHAWTFEVIADIPPSISLQRPPDVTASQALRLIYSVEDDYGIVSAEARFRPLEAGLAAADPLIPAPDFPLTLPQMRAQSGTAQTIRDLAAHPWAGSQVRLTLVARDDLGQEGMSEPVELTLPQRRFFDPLARAVVEQRRELALDRGAVGDVAMALDALTMEPERHIADYGIYLGLRSAYWRLRNARGDDETLVSVVDQLWEIALQLEDGDLSLAARDLRAAQERLMRALEEGASDAEIERLMAELREALDQFLAEMARRAMENQQAQQPMPIDPNARMFSRNDLQRLLDAIENMARSGSRDAARQMLSELQNLLENLQNGQMQAGPMQAGPMGEALDRLGEMIRRQQQLMDETHRFDQQQGQGQPEDGQRSQELGQLGQGQGDLRQQLQELLDQLRGMGVDPGNELGQAGEAMGEAEQSLGAGETGEALGQQGRALDNLRRGAQSMAEQMAQGQGMGNAPGQPGQARQRTDPFGRPLRTEGPDYGVTVRVPEEIDVQRAREILQELRRRLSDPARPRLERDYIERLLERF